MRNFSQYELIFLSTLFFTLFYNFSFFTNVVNTYSFQGFNKIYVLSTAILLISFLTLFFTILSSKYTTKPILLITTVISAFTAYFMDTYHVVIDSEMIRCKKRSYLNTDSRNT